MTIKRTETFDAALPASITSLTSGVTWNSTNQTLASDNVNSNAWWLDDNAWDVGDFDITFEVAFSASGALGFGFWFPQSGTTTRGPGYRFYIRSGNGGVQTVNSGGTGTFVSGNTALPALGLNVMYVARIIANATTGDATFTLTRSTDSVVVYDVTHTLPAGNRSGVFGQSPINFGSNYQLDNLSLIAPAGDESVAISVGESSQVVAPSTPISGTDTAAISVTETTSLFKTGIQAADQSAISVSEQRALFGQLVSSDTAGISVNDVGNAPVALSRTDSVSISVAETRTIVVAHSRTDTAAISVGDTSSSFRTMPVTDGAAISVSESATVGGFFLVASSDTLVFGLTDSGLQTVPLPPEIEISVTDVASPKMDATHQVVDISVTQAAPASISVTEVYV
jgi:hypothetical protein